MKLYHVSTDLKFKEYFLPRIPSSRAQNEDHTIPRICFATSIEGCLMSMPDGGTRFEETYINQKGLFRVYELDLDKVNLTNFKTSEELWKAGLVDDADDCGEYWIMSPVYFNRSSSYIIHIDSWGTYLDDIIPYDVYVEGEKTYAGNYCAAYEAIRGKKIPSNVFFEDIVYNKLSKEEEIEARIKHQLDFKMQNVSEITSPEKMEFPFAGECLCVYSNNVLIGLVDYYIFSHDTLFINQFEIFKEFSGQGYGTDILRKMLISYPIEYIEGVSTEEASRFYENVGCNFFTTCDTCKYTKCSLHPERVVDGEYLDDFCESYSEYHFKISKDTIR